MTDNAVEAARAPVWKRVVASILDAFTVFFVAGYVVARLTGDLTENGFELHGAPAFAVFAIVIVYFFVGRRFAGGTLWDRIFRIKRPQPS